MNITVIVSKALNKENWKKGVNYLNKYGVKGFIRKLKHLSPDTDYNKWFLEQRVSDKLFWNRRIINLNMNLKLV